MVIDPILPLVISIAEAKGTYALFLGSGISRSAGIPTGTELTEQLKKKLYTMDKGIENINNEDDFQKWLDEKEIKNMGYSDLLNQIPSEEERRIFLEQFFSKAEPSETHKTIAKLVENGFIKCIITTNFDRLIESSLDEKKINFDVVASSYDLDILKPREHSKCRLYKIHGDYKALIKNTEKELEKLDPEIEEEFKEILDNYGIIFAGYSGSDNTVLSCLEKRISKYTLYWLKRDKLKSRISEIIKQQDGREIEITSSDKFFLDLLNKIEYYSHYETGETPEFLIYMTKNYIKDRNRVDFSESLKKQMRQLENEWFRIYNRLVSSLKNGDKILIINALKEFERYLDSITAISLVLIEYPNNCIDQIFKLFQDIYNLSTIIFEDKSEYTIHSQIVDIPKSALHNLYYTIGAFCLKTDNLAPLSTLFRKQLILGSNTKYIWNTDVFYTYTFNQNPDEMFKFLIDTYEYKEHFKEFFRSKTEFQIYLCQFNLIQSLYISKMMIKFPTERIGFNPSFSQYPSKKEKIMIPLIKCKSNPIYLEEMSKVFEENSNQFENNYKERCEKVNTVINGGIYVFKLPLDIIS